MACAYHLTLLLGKQMLCHKSLRGLKLNVETLKKHSWGLFSWHPENKYHQDCIMPGVCAKSQNILLLQIHKYSNLQGKEYNGFKIPLELPWLPWGRCSWGQIRKATKYQITFKRSPVGSKWTERSLVWDELLWWKTNSKVRWWFCWSIFCTHTKQ